MKNAARGRKRFLSRATEGAIDALALNEVTSTSDAAERGFNYAIREFDRGDSGIGHKTASAAIVDRAQIIETLSAKLETMQPEIEARRAELKAIADRIKSNMAALAAVPEMPF